MKATEILEQEHRIIEQVASACGVCAEVLRGGGRVPPAALESIVGFFRQYGDQYHRQEEEMLLTMLREKGVASGSCPIAVIDYENQKRKVLLEQLSSAAAAYAKSDGKVNGAVIETLTALAEFFPDHIWKEDYVLLPMAEKLLSDEDQQILGGSLHLIESIKGAEARRALERLNGAIHHCMETVTHSREAQVA